MNRRVAIKKASLMLGMAMSSPVILSILNGCVPKKTINWSPLFFNKDQALLIANLSDLILPRTDTPGALDIGVDAFIDFIINSCYSKKEQQNFLIELNEINKESQLKGNDVFINLSEENQLSILSKLEATTTPVELPIGSSGKPFFSMLKELTLLGYFTSEEIMTNHMEYVPIPSRLDGCIPLRLNQKAVVGN